MPKPSGTTGPNPKPAKAGFPQLLVDSTVWFSCFHGLEWKKAGALFDENPPIVDTKQAPLELTVNFVETIMCSKASSMQPWMLQRAKWQKEISDEATETRAQSIEFISRSSSWWVATEWFYDQFYTALWCICYVGIGWTRCVEGCFLISWRLFINKLTAFY